MCHSQLFQACVQVGLKEPAEPRLIDDIVARLWREFRNEVRVPVVSFFKFAPEPFLQGFGVALILWAKASCHDGGATARRR
jgi:hypothetical protein